MGVVAKSCAPCLHLHRLDLRNQIMLLVRFKQMALAFRNRTGVTVKKEVDMHKETPKTDMVTGDQFEELNQAAVGLAIPTRRDLSPQIHGWVPQTIEAGHIVVNSPSITITEKDSILDLPDEVKKNLVGYDQMELETLISNIFKLYNHPITVDRIVTTLWHNHKKSPDRGKVIRTVRQLVSYGVVAKVGGTKATYTLAMRATPPQSIQP